MPVVTIRNLPEETHRALKQRAASHGRSTEAEIRDILEQAVNPGYPRQAWAGTGGVWAPLRRPGP